MVDGKREVKTHHGSTWGAASSEPGRGPGPTGSLGPHHGIQQLPSSQAPASYITTLSSSLDTPPPVPPASILQLEQTLADRPALRLLHDVATHRVGGAEFYRRFDETGLQSQEHIGSEIFELATLMGGPFMDDEVREGLLREVVPLGTEDGDEDQQEHHLRALAAALGAPQLSARHRDALLDAVLDRDVGTELCPALLVVYEVLGGKNMPDDQYVGFVNKVIDRASRWPTKAMKSKLKDAMISLASAELPPKRLHLLLDNLWKAAVRPATQACGHRWLALLGKSLGGTPQMDVLHAWVLSKFSGRACMEDEPPLRYLVLGHVRRMMQHDAQPYVMPAESAKFAMACLLAAARANASPRCTQKLAWIVLRPVQVDALDETGRSAILEAVREVLPRLAPLHRMVLVMQVGTMLPESGGLAARLMLCDALCGPPTASPGRADAKGTLEVDDGPALRDLVDLALRALEDPFELLRAELDDALRFACFEFAAEHAGPSFRSREPPSLWNVPKDIPAPMRWRYLLRLPDLPVAGFDVPDFVRVHDELMAAIESDATWHEREATASIETKASSSDDEAAHAAPPSMQEVLRFYEAFEVASGLRLDDEQGRLFPLDKPEDARAKADALRAALQDIVLAVRRSGDKAHSFARNRAIQFIAVLRRLEETLPPLEEQVYSAMSASSSDTGFTARPFRTLARDRILLAEHPDKRTAAVLARVIACGCPEAELERIVQALLEDAPDEQTSQLMRRGVAEVLAKDKAREAKAHQGSSCSAPAAARLEQALAADPALRLLHEVAMGQVDGPEFAPRLEETGLASRGDLGPEIAELATLMGGPHMDDEAREGLLRRVVPLSTTGGDVDQAHIQFSALGVALGGPQMAAWHRDALMDSVLDGSVSREPSYAMLVLFRLMGGRDMPADPYADFVRGMLDRAARLDLPQVQFSKAIRHIARPEQPPERWQVLLETSWDTTAHPAVRDYADAWTHQAVKALAGTPRMSVAWAAPVSTFARRAHRNHDLAVYVLLRQFIWAIQASRGKEQASQPGMSLAETVMVNCVLPVARAGASPWTTTHLASFVFDVLRHRHEATERIVALAAVRKILPGLPPLHLMALVMRLGEVLGRYDDPAARRKVCEALCSPADAKGTPERGDGPATRDLVDLALRALHDPFELLRADLDDALRFGSLEFVAEHLPENVLDVPRDISPLMRWHYLLRLFEIVPSLHLVVFPRIHSELMRTVEADANWPKGGAETKASGPRAGASQASLPPMSEVLRFNARFQEVCALRLDEAQGRLFPRELEEAREQVKLLRAELQDIVLGVRRAGHKVHPFARARAIHFTAMLRSLEEMLPPLEEQVDGALAVSSSDTEFLPRQFRTLARDRIVLAEHPDKVMAVVLARVFASGRSEAELRQIVQALFADAPDKQTARLLRKAVVDFLAQDTDLTAPQRAAVRLAAGVTRQVLREKAAM